MRIGIESLSQKMVLESNLERVIIVKKPISRVREEYTITVENDNYIGIVLSKAVSNVIKHGNKFDPAKKVRLKVETKNDRSLFYYKG